MSTVSEFLTMGGYAPFVWPAFGLTAVVMVGLVVASRRSLRANEETLEALQSRRAERRAGAAPESEAAVESKGDA